VIGLPMKTSCLQSLNKTEIQILSSRLTRLCLVHLP
jgi:hypothetical protein